jgi:hypothetical protein
MLRSSKTSGRCQSSGEGGMVPSFLVTRGPRARVLCCACAGVSRWSRRCPLFFLLHFGVNRWLFLFDDARGILYFVGWFFLFDNAGWTMRCFLLGYTLFPLVGFWSWPVLLRICHGRVSLQCLLGAGIFWNCHGRHPRISLRRMDARVIAFSKCFKRFRRDSALYQAAPRRDLPLILGIVEVTGGLVVEKGWGGRSATAFAASSLKTEVPLIRNELYVRPIHIPRAYYHYKIP